MSASPASLPPINEVSIPHQSIYPSMLELRVSSLERAIKFFTQILSFKIIGHQEYDDQSIDQSNNQSSDSGKNQSTDQSTESPRCSRYSLTDVAPSLNSDFRFRLRFNYNQPLKPSINHCETGLRHIELYVPGALSRAKVNGYKTNTEDGQPIVYGPDEIPFLFNEMGGANNSQTAILSPTQSINVTGSPRHRRGSIDASSPTSGGAVTNPIITISLWTRDLDSTFAFYSKTFGLSPVECDTRRADTILLAFDDPDHPTLEFVQLPADHELLNNRDFELSVAAKSRQAIDAVSQRVGAESNDKGVVVTDIDQRPIHVFDRSLLKSSGHVTIDWNWRVKHGSNEHSSQHNTPRGTVRKVEEAMLDDNQFETGGDNDKTPEHLRNEFQRKRSL